MINHLAAAQRIADCLRQRGETLAVSESSTGGLVSAALVAIPGASAYFLGGAVVYTLQARRVLLDVPDAAMRGLRSATEAYAALAARSIRERLGATWGLSETGATGPTGNPYGDPAGHTCIAVSGRVERALTLETGIADRIENMDRFAAATLALLAEALEI
jgi:PncC family amidohydrolase